MEEAPAIAARHGISPSGPVALPVSAVQAGERVYAFSTSGLCVIAAIAAVLLVTFRSSVVWLWQTWVARPEYSHGPILPAIAAFLVWQQKERLRQLEFPGSVWGVAAVAAAGTLFLLGVIGAVYTLQQYAFVVALAGLALAVLGPRILASLAIPLLLLVLMVPPPSFILNNLSAQLQLLSSAVGVAFIRALGISVYLEGNVIDLGGYRLQVVEACDGMRYLFPLMTIGLLIAYFYKGAIWKRALVFVASVPIALLMNSLRVGTIGVLVEHWGTAMAEGFLHEFQGWMVFMLSAALLLGLAAGLNRLGGEALPWRDAFGVGLPPARPHGQVPVTRRMPAALPLAAAVLVAFAVTAALLPVRGEVVPDRSTFVDFPMELGSLKGHRQPLDSAMLEVLQLDDYVLADFVDQRGPGTNLYISYYAAQQDRRVVHSPRACIPGGGWHIEQLTQAVVPRGGPAVNRMVIANGESRQLVYYWFEQRGRVLTNELLVKWYLFWDALTRRRTDGAMIRLITPIPANEPAGKADERLIGMAQSLRPLLPRYVPH